MSYLRRNSNSSSNKSDVNGNSGNFRKSASVEPRSTSSNCSNSSDYGSSGKEGKKNSLLGFWHNLFKSNKITEKDESQSSDDKRSSKSSSSYESVNTILSTNSFSFVSPKKYKGKPVKGKRIPVDDATLPRKQQEPSSSASNNTGNPSRRKVTTTFGRLGMKIGLKSKYNLQSCESLHHLNQLEDRNASNSYVTTWRSNSNTFSGTNKRRAPLPPAEGPPNHPVSQSPQSPPPPVEVSSATPTATVTSIAPAATAITSSSITVAEPSAAASNLNAKPPVKPNDGKTHGKVQEHNKPSTSYSTKVVTSSNRYSIGHFVNNGNNGRSFVITAGRHRRAVSEGQNPINTLTNSNTGTKGRIHVRGKKKAPPPPNPFGDPDAEDDSVQTLRSESRSSNSNSNRNSLILTDSLVPLFPPSQSSLSTAPLHSQPSSQSQTQNDSKSNKPLPPPKPCIENIRAATSSNNNKQINNSNNSNNNNKSVTAIGSRNVVAANNPEVTAVSVPRANVVQASIPEVPAARETENIIRRNDLNAVEDEIAQNILNDKQEQERELEQQRQQQQQTVDSASSLTTSHAHEPSASSANSSRHLLTVVSTHHQPATEQEMQAAKNELEALVKDNPSGSLEAQAKKVDEQVKAQLLQLKREADKSPLLFLAPKPKQPSSPNPSNNSSSMLLSSPNSPIPPSSPEINKFFPASTNAATIPVNSSTSPTMTTTSPPPLPAKITPRPWYKRSSSSSSKNKNKNTKPISVLPNFSELDREATRIVEENRRKSAEQAYNETARELISMFNEFNRDQIHGTTPSASPLPPETPPVDSSTNNVSTNKTSNSVSSSGVATPDSTRGSIASSVSTFIITATVTPTPPAVSLPSSSVPRTCKDIKPLPTGNASGNANDETKKLAIVQPQAKTNNNGAANKTAPVSDNSLLPSNNAKPSSQNLQTTSTSVVSVTQVPKTVPTTSSNSTSTPSTTPSSIFSYKSSSFGNPISRLANNNGSTTKTIVATNTTTIENSTTTTVVSSFVTGSEWTCPRCTLTNAHWRNLCDACYFRRNTPVQSSSMIFDRINAQIKASSPGPTNIPSSKLKSTEPEQKPRESLVSSSSAVEKPTQWVKPKTCDVPPCENLLSQLPNKENLAKEGKLEGMKLYEDPEVEELDIAKVREARLAFFARTKLEKEEQQYNQQQVNESKPNNLALACVEKDNNNISYGSSNDAKQRNVFSDGEDDTLDEILQSNTTTKANICNNNNSNCMSMTNGPRVWKPLHVNRFRPMLESILEADGGYYNLDKIYENWHLSERNDDEYGYDGHWTNTFMQIQDKTNSRADQANSNNLLSNSSEEEFDADDPTMEGATKSKRRQHRNSHSNQNQSQNLVNARDNFVGCSSSSTSKDKKLTLEDYRKLGAIPKNYCYSQETQPNMNGTENTYSNINIHDQKGTVRQEGNGISLQGQLSSASNSNFSDHTFAVSKLLRKLENAISNGDHRLAATLAHDLALLRVNCVVNKSSEPITLRVYVEDRFMQQGPFLVQVTPTMSVRDLKLKIESDWGIPNTFQKWILGRKMAEDDSETLSSHEIIHDSMAFLYLVTPDGDTNTLKSTTNGVDKKSKLDTSEEMTSGTVPKSLPRSKQKKVATDIINNTQPSPVRTNNCGSNLNEFSAKSLGRQNKGKVAPSNKGKQVAASSCQTESSPKPPQIVSNRKESVPNKTIEFLQDSTEDVKVTVFFTANQQPILTPASNASKQSVLPASTANQKSAIPASAANQKSVMPASSANQKSVMPASAANQKSVIPASAANQKSVLPTSTTNQLSVLPTSKANQQSVLPTSTTNQLSVLPTSKASQQSVLPASTASKQSLLPASTAKQQSESFESYTNKQSVLPTPALNQSSMLPATDTKQQSVLPVLNHNQQPIVPSSTANKPPLPPTSSQNQPIISPASTPNKSSLPPTSTANQQSVVPSTTKQSLSPSPTSMNKPSSSPAATKALQPIVPSSTPNAQSLSATSANQQTVSQQPFVYQQKSATTSTTNKQTFSSASISTSTTTLQPLASISTTVKPTLSPPSTPTSNPILLSLPSTTTQPTTLADSHQMPASTQSPKRLSPTTTANQPLVAAPVIKTVAPAKADKETLGALVAEIVNQRPTYPPRSRKDSKDRSLTSSPKVEPIKSEAKVATLPAPVSPTITQIQQPSNNKPAVISQISNGTTGIKFESQSQSPVPSLTKKEPMSPPPQLPPKAPKTEKRNIVHELNIPNESSSPVQTISTEKNPGYDVPESVKTENSSLFKFIEANSSNKVNSLPLKSKSEPKEACMIEESTPSPVITPTPTPRLSKIENGFKIPSFLRGNSKPTSLPLKNNMKLLDDEKQNDKSPDTPKNIECLKPENNGAKIFQPPWRTSLIVESEPEISTPTTSKPEKDNSVFETTKSIDGGSAAVETNAGKPIPLPRQQLETKIQLTSGISSDEKKKESSPAKSVVTTSTVRESVIGESVKGESVVIGESIKGESVKGESVKGENNTKSGGANQLNDVPITPSAVEKSKKNDTPSTVVEKFKWEPLKRNKPLFPIAVKNNTTVETKPQNYSLKQPSSFLPAQNVNKSTVGETPETNISTSTNIEVSITPMFPNNEKLFAETLSDAEPIPNWNPEPIPKRRSKLIKKNIEKSNQEADVEIKLLNVEPVGTTVSTEINDYLNVNREGIVPEVKGNNDVTKKEPIYQNPNDIVGNAATSTAPKPTSLNSSSGVDGFCQTTLKFPAKVPQPHQQQQPTPQTQITESSDANTTQANVPAVQDIIMPQMARKNSDSSVINMESSQLEDKKPSEIVKDFGFETTNGPLEGATAVLDEKKENNVETYLKMLQLMEKADLINSSEVSDCPVCFNTVPVGEGIVLRDCLHVFCKECLIGAVQYAEESEVKCPFRDNDYSCNSALQEREIKALVPPEIFEKYLARSVKLAESKIVNTFHCKTNDCTGWCIFEDDVNTFKCPVCQKRNCLTCQAIHEEIDCLQFQRELAIAAETDENAKSSRLMLEQMIQRGEALECPACHVVLLKKWGCDWVRCSYCKTEICWVTRNFRWGPGGKGDTSGGCKCGVNGIRCHPKCTYCH